MSISAGILFPLPTVGYDAICPRCGGRIPGDHRFCGHCGVDLREYAAWQKAVRPCEKCRKKIPFLAYFCPDCGARQV